MAPFSVSDRGMLDNMRALGFQYTWTYRGESTTLKEIFDNRMMRNLNVAPKVRKLKQTNVTTVKA